VPTPRESWITEGLRALAAGGPDAVRVESLAKALGVTKGGFYWHFQDRPALLVALLETWERMSVTDVIADVEAGGGDGRARLRRLFSLAGARPDVLQVDLAVRDWARRDGAVGRRLRGLDNQRMEYMRSLLRDFCEDDDDVEVRAMLAFSLWIGNHFIAAEHGRRSRREVMDLAMRRLLQE
jgi:AcrR family transcriptional regulator